MWSQAAPTESPPLPMMPAAAVAAGVSTAGVSTAGVPSAGVPSAAGELRPLELRLLEARLFEGRRLPTAEAVPGVHLWLLVTPAKQVESARFLRLVRARIGRPERVEPARAPRIEPAPLEVLRWRPLHGGRIASRTAGVSLRATGQPAFRPAVSLLRSADGRGL